MKLPDPNKMRLESAVTAGTAYRTERVPLERARLAPGLRTEGKLDVIDPSPGMEYRFANDDVGRILELEEAGWLVDLTARAKGVTNVKGSTRQLRAGVREDGSQRNAVLMSRPKEYRVRSDEIARQSELERRKGLDPKAHAVAGKQDAGKYEGQVEYLR